MLLKRENSNYREWQTDGTPVNKYYIAWAKKIFDITLNVSYSGERVRGKEGVAHSPTPKFKKGEGGGVNRKSGEYG